MKEQPDDREMTEEEIDECARKIFEKNYEKEYYETGEPFRAMRYPTSFNIQVQAGTWEFGDGEITFTHNDGTVDTIYKNGILYGKEEENERTGET